MVSRVSSKNTLLNAVIGNDVTHTHTLHCLCVRSTDRNNECRSTDTHTHTHMYLTQACIHTPLFMC